MKGIQFELWKNCTNGCEFCFNRGLACSNDVNKIRILKEVYYRIERLNYDYYDQIGFIGGELFGNQLLSDEVYDNFHKLFELCVSLVKSGKIKQVNFTSNLLNKDNGRLFDILDYIKEHKVLHKFEICTSYDSKYRFKDNFDLWDKTLLYIKENYPELQTHIEILPTQDFCEKCLSGEIDILEIKERYNSAVDYSDLNSGFFYKDKFEMEKNVPGFFPRRDTFKKWLITGFSRGWFVASDICNYDVFFNELYMLSDKIQLVQYIREGHCEQLPYGDVNKSDYIDSNVLMYKDIKEIWEKYKKVA